MKPEHKAHLFNASVWLARLIVGAIFILSGWSKAIDPWGFAIKVGEYLSVWQLIVPHEAVIVSCIALSCIEFCTGILIAVGALKRFAVITAAAIMAFMLPLTLYIAVFNPVADCGCFGDFMIIPNWLTFAKNVAATALIVFLLICNPRVSGLYPPPIQWLVIVLSQAFPLVLALAGYQIQPLVDFRPYKTGSVIFSGDTNDTEETFTYEKNGETRKFHINELPDSTWTFVEDDIVNVDSFDSGITVRDDFGNDVSADIVSPDAEQLFLIVPEPGMHYLSFAHYVNLLYDYCRKNEIEMIAVVGNDRKRLERWEDWCQPQFDVFTADPVSLKQLVRGPEALVFTDGGRIVWKRTLNSMPQSKVSDLRSLEAPDSGLYHGIILLSYLAGMIIVYLLGLSPKILRFFIKRTK